MMIEPGGKAVFIEVPKTGSTACTIHLRDQGHWFQNGARGRTAIPGTFMGRHSHLTDDTLKELGVVAYGVVRNPWDRMASLWRASSPGSTPFISYMKRGSFRHGPFDLMTKPQHDWLERVDHVIRYEELDRLWDQMAWQFGHLPLGPIDPANVSRRRTVPEWTDEELDIVAERFAIDIETYGYTGPS